MKLTPSIFFLSVLALASQPTSAPAQTPASLHGLGPVNYAGAYVGSNESTVQTGDVDGDGYDDAVIFMRGTPGQVGDVFVALNQSGFGFAEPTKWHEFFCIGAEIPLVADFNGDGRADVITFVRSTQTGSAEADVYVALSNGTNAFVNSSLWHDSFCYGTEIPLVGDFNGDGRADIATCVRGAAADVYVATSTGSSFSGNGWLWHDNFCQGAAVPLAADVNGDGYCDLVCFHRSAVGREGDVHVALSFAEVLPTFFGDVKWHDSFCFGTEMPQVGDVNGDGAADILTYNATAFAMYVALSSSATSEFVGTGQLWREGLGQASLNPQCFAANFNGDRNADIVSAGSSSLVPATGHLYAGVAGAMAEPMTDPAVLATTYGYGTMGTTRRGSIPPMNPPLASRPAREQRNLLVIMLAAPANAAAGRTAFSLTAAQMSALAFGPGNPSIRGFFDEMSGGKFTFQPAALPATVNLPGIGNITTASGVIGPIPITSIPANTWNFGVQVIDPAFNYAAFDTSPADGIVGANELTILIVDNISENAAATRYVLTTLDGKTIDMPVAASGHVSALQNPSHELAHCLGAWDMYNSGQTTPLVGCYAQNATLMSCTAGPTNNNFTHLDGWHKMRLGWTTPRAYGSKSPGSAVISAAQLRNSSGFEQPIILGSTRPEEFYVLEYRTNQLPTGSTFWSRPGGYDNDVAGTGLAAWYVRTQTSNELLTIPSIIQHGTDCILQTSPTGDDQLSPRSYFVSLRDNNGNVTCSGSVFEIFPGANGIIDTSVNSADVAMTDNLCVMSITPANLFSRQAVVFYNDPAVNLTPQWWDLTGPTRGPVADNFNMRTVDFGDRCCVEWGPVFTPWIDRPLLPIYSAGREQFILGNFGIRTRGADGTSFPVLVAADGSETDLPVTNEVKPGHWDGRGVSFNVPLSVPSGSYGLRVYRSAARTLVSNTWNVTVENPWDDWLILNFSPAERANPTLACEDPDRDGLSNLLEFVISSDPHNGSDGNNYITYSVGSGSLTYQWSGLLSTDSFFDVLAEYSTNLQTWQPITGVTRIESGSYAFYTANMPTSVGPRAFVRLKAACP